ncbi:MAG: glycosyltransferase family 4 protein [Elusimicrobiota bacterium]|jgi:glycosyltransferase involved in cell wall biosynthesis|nr:glycosyltransferase family 4 protein [Elusimicrobiota bacterium]
MGKTKIAFIITKLELGGAQKSVLYSARDIDKTRFEPYLLAGAGGYFDAYAKENIKNIFFIPALQRAVNPLKDMRALTQIMAALKKIKPRIVHTNSSKAGILGRAAAMLMKPRPKIVHTVHGFGFNDYQNFLMRSFYIFLERLLARGTDILIFVSLADIQTALRLKIAPAQKCRLIRAGVELKTKTDFKKSDITAEFGLPGESKIVLCAANLKPQKNPLDMVRAAQIVCAQMPETVFLYLGAGELEGQTRALINKYKLQSNFRLLGRRGDVERLLAAADCFALSSLWEGLPMALIEALSMHVPAACYDAGGISEVLHSGKNGYLVKRGDFAGLAQGIINILRGDLIFDAKAVDLKEFDAKEMLQKQQDLWSNAAALRNT